MKPLHELSKRDLRSCLVEAERERDAWQESAIYLDGELAAVRARAEAAEQQLREAEEALGELNEAMVRVLVSSGQEGLGALDELRGRHAQLLTRGDKAFALKRACAA